MALYNTGTTLGSQLSNMMSHIIAAKQIADRLSGDFAALETNGGATDGDYLAISTAMAISGDSTGSIAHGLVSLNGTIQADLASIVALGGFYKWDPGAN